MCNNSL